MAFSFGPPQTMNAKMNAGGMSNSGQMQDGPDLVEVQTEEIGFKALAGEAKLQLLRSPWPSDALPPPTASLLSIAPRAGILAAGGSDSVVIASTDSVRKAFTTSSAGASKFKPFTAQLYLELGMRISQVAFSADEGYLVLSAETGGGLAVYEVPNLLQGNTQPSFQLPTNSTSLRALVPNPTTEKAELFAVVTSSGELLIANLKSRDFIQGSTGPVMKNGVSCVSWSNKGKQLAAGLGDGTVFQMTPEGKGKAEVPRPSYLANNEHVSSLSWLENDTFLTAHTPSNFDSDTIPPATYSIVTRSGNVHQAQRLPEVCSLFGLNRSPPTQLFQRLRDYPPNLRDVIIVCSTVSEDIGLITRSKTPLSTDYPAEQIADTFTTTMIALDNRRAGLPMTESFETTSPIGMALDLSSNEAVDAPIPGDEIQSTEMPLPGLMALNNEGILSIWWIIYRDAVRQKAAYPGLVHATANVTQQAQKFSMGNSVPPTTSTFGQPQKSTSASGFGSAFGSATSSAFASSSPLGKPSTAFGNTNASSTTGSAFGAPPTPGNAASAFGTSNVLGNTGGAFGATSGMGNKPSPWAALGSAQKPDSTFDSTSSNNPVFGSSNALGTPSSGPSFGSSGGLGNRQSVWGSSAATSTPTATFGAPGGSALSGSPFGSNTPAAAFGSAAKLIASLNSGGFASFANNGGFLAVATQNKGEDVLSKSNNTLSFDSNMDTSSSFGAATPKKFGESAFDAATPMSATATPLKANDAGGLFGLGGGFKLGSNFRGDGTAKDDAPKPPPPDKPSSLFGLDFGKSVDDVQQGGQVPEIKEADMLSDASDKSDNPATPDTPEKTSVRPTTTPADTPAPSKFFAPPTAPPSTGGLFGTQAQTQTTPAAVQTSAPTAISPNEQAPGPGSSRADDGKAIKLERQPSEDQKRKLENIPEAPLPPDPRSKENYNSADSSQSSTDDSNAPKNHSSLPPDLVFPKNGPQNAPKAADESTSPDESPPSKETSQAESKLPEDQELPTKETDSDFDSAEISESEHGIDDEDSGVDVARELTPPPEADKSPETTRGQRIRDNPRLFGKPNYPLPQSGKSLFGEIGSPPILAPSHPKDHELPRSPSPTRPSKGLEMLRVENRPESSRSFSESMLPNRNVEKIKLGLSRTIVPHQIRKTVEELQAEELRREEQREAKRAAEEQALEDEDDLRIHQELEAPIEPTLTLAPFLSHQDYVGHIDKEGIPWQIESLYRDMNSMVDLLGLNARSLDAFILGHDKYYGSQIDSDILDTDRDWCLNDVCILHDLEEDFEARLQDFSLEELQARLFKCSELRQELSSLKNKRGNIQRAVELRNNPAHLEALRTAALPADQATLQNDLRKSFIATQKLLADAEEQIVLLRAKLAVCGATSGPNTPGFGAQKAPTVEAIQKTIAKMTSMVERKSGDIDVLELQMRKLKELDLGERRSRQGTPAVGTPSRKAIGTPGSGGFFTPRSSRLGASVGSLSGGGGTPGGGVGHGTEVLVLEEQARRYEEKVRRRREVNGLVKRALVKGGMRVRTLDDV